LLVCAKILSGNVHRSWYHILLLKEKIWYEWDRQKETFYCTRTFIIKFFELGVVDHACNPRTQEAKAAG
jgi:hypothetical protein